MPSLQSANPKVAVASTDFCTQLKEYAVEPRLNFYKAGPEAMKAIIGLELLVNTINSWNRFAIAFRKLPA